MIVLNTTLELNVWDLAVKGGWLMIPIVLLSFAGIYIICERWFFLQRIEKQNRIFLMHIKTRLESGNYKGALSECLAHDLPAAQMLHLGIKHKHLPAPELRNIMEAKAGESIASLERGLPTLANVSSLAPMIGFLGTVVGMVQAFYDMSLAGNNINISLLSRGIYTAMITTVAGLIVGIISLCGYNILVSRVDRITRQMNRACESFIELLYELNR